PAPGVWVMLSPGIAFSHIPFSAPPRGIHEPPCGPVMNVTCCAAAGAAKSALTASASRGFWTFIFPPRWNRSIRCGRNNSVADRLGRGPHAKEVVIDGGERHERGVAGSRVAQGDNRHVEVEEEGALGVVAHHALDPEEACEARAAGHRGHAMAA